MKVEDFERLKAVCEKDGFELELTNSEGKYLFITANKKDEWEGVEFVTDDIKVYKVHEITGNWVYYGSHIDGEKERAGKTFLKPSTEQSYIDQLKHKAFELYGEIKEGDEFTAATGGTYQVKTYDVQPEFDYFKKVDQLFYKNVQIYCEGKWAKKIEKVRVEFLDFDYRVETERLPIVTFSFQMIPKGDLKSTGIFLASKLEEYLNQ
jgi:hypothetical protein